MHTPERGMSLVEVMVAVAIGMIGILIIMQAYLTSENFNRTTVGEGSAQTNGAVALFTVERDLRMGGYGINESSLFGCGEIYWYYDNGSTPQYSSNVNPGSTLAKITLAPVYIDDTVTDKPHKIAVMYATSPDMVAPSSIKSFNPHSSVAELTGTLGFHKNDLILLANAGGCTLAKITKDPESLKIQFNPGVNGQYNPAAWGSFPTNYAEGDKIVNLGVPKIRTYAIVDDTLQVSDALLQAAGQSALDIVDGIVDMRAQYGMDNGAGGAAPANDGVVDEYTNTQPATAADWKQLLSVRIAVLARIGNYEKPSGAACEATTSANAPKWANNTRDFTFPEGLPSCYRYRVFETTVPLRNLIWALTP
jgi:type IV pilus assembly protein PilW